MFVPARPDVAELDRGAALDRSQVLEGFRRRGRRPVGVPVSFVPAEDAPVVTLRPRQGFPCDPAFPGFVSSKPDRRRRPGGRGGQLRVGGGVDDPGRGEALVRLERNHRRFGLAAENAVDDQRGAGRVELLLHVLDRRAFRTDLELGRSQGGGDRAHRKCSRPPPLDRRRFTLRHQFADGMVSGLGLQSKQVLGTRVATNRAGF